MTARVPGRKAYVVFIKEAERDAEEMARYKAAVGASFEGHAPNFLAAYGALEVLEGAPAEGVVILEFEDMDKARAWYRSPAYQAAAQHRFKGADYRGLIVEGLDTAARG